MANVGCYGAGVAVFVTDTSCSRKLGRTACEKKGAENKIDEFHVGSPLVGIFLLYAISTS